MKDTLIGFGTAAIIIWLWESGKLKQFATQLPSPDQVFTTSVNASSAESENEDITEIEFVP